MTARERIAGNILEGAVFLKRGKQVTKTASIDEILDDIQFEWIEE